MAILGHKRLILIFMLLALCCTSIVCAQNKGKKEESNENINKWLNSPQLKELAGVRASNTATPRWCSCALQ